MSTPLTATPKQALSFFTEARHILVLGLPIMATQLAQTAMGFVDTVMAGRYGDLDLAGVAIGTSLWIPLFLAVVGILMATTPLCAQAFGAKDHGAIRHTIQQAFWLALVLSAIGGGILWFVNPIFELMNVDTEVAEISNRYLRALSWGMPAVALYQVLRSANEALHRTQPIMLISFIALLCNIPLNYIFIYGKFGLPAMGGEGCGWASTAVLWIQFFALLAYSYRSELFAKVQFWRNWQKPELVTQQELLWVGVPIGFSIFIEASMFTLIALFLAPLGHEVVAAHQITISLTSLTFMVPLSLGMALTIRCGFSLGTGDPVRTRFISKTGLKLAFLTSACTASFIVLMAPYLASLYTANANIQAIAVSLMLLAAIFQCSDALQVIAAGALRGYKDTRIPLIGIFIAYWLIGLPFGYSLGMTDFWGQQYGAKGFWVGNIAGLTVAAILLIIRLNYISRKTIRMCAATAPPRHD